MRHALTCLAVGALLAARPSGAQVTLVGHVRDEDGLAVSGAEVRVPGTALVATTDRSGAFRLRGVPANTTSLGARRLGFRPALRDLSVADGSSSDVLIILDVAAQPLPTVTVKEYRERFDPRLAGFRHRMARQFGHFITRDKIEDSSAPSLTELLRGTPGVGVGRLRNASIPNSVRMRGSPCPPVVFLDGFSLGDREFDLDVISLESIEGVEVYNGTATAPVELMGPPGLDKCGVIAIWSRLPGKATTKPAKAGTLLKETDAETVFPADKVDSEARVFDKSFAPVYPDSLWRRAIEGYARVEFVVDTMGRAEMEYFSVVSESHGGFGDAVRGAVEGAQFIPAVRKQKKVRQVVLMPVHFERPPAAPKPGA